jgi:hypothetical protein
MYAAEASEELVGSLACLLAFLASWVGVGRVRALVFACGSGHGYGMAVASKPFRLGMVVDGMAWYGTGMTHRRGQN